MADVTLPQLGEKQDVYPEGDRPDCETFIVDPYGIVRYQHIGPLERKDIATIRDKWASLRK